MVDDGNNEQLASGVRARDFVEMHLKLRRGGTLTGPHCSGMLTQHRLVVGYLWLGLAYHFHLQESGI